MLAYDYYNITWYTADNVTRKYHHIFIIAYLSLVVSLPAFIAHAGELPNENGRIPIFVYHTIGEKETRWQRSYVNLRKDLEWLYNNDFRTISMQEFLSGVINLPAGMKPVVLTFDDGASSQLSFSGDIVDPKSAVGIMDIFILQHPKFGSSAVFFVNNKPFAKGKETDRALKYLLNTGRELGNHTMHHINLDSYDAGRVEKEIKDLALYVHDIDSRAYMTSLAYPYGAIKNGPNLDIVKKYSKIAVLVGAEPALPRYHVGFDPYKVARVQAIDSEWLHWFGRRPGEVNKTDIPPFHPLYVSDGNTNTLSVHSEKYLDVSRVPAGMTITIVK